MIGFIPQDPTDLVLQGEQMRSQAIAGGIHAAPAPLLSSLVLGGANEPSDDLYLMVEDEEVYSPMVGGYPVPPLEILRDPFAGTMLRNNAMLCTPCGASYPVMLGQHIMDLFIESTTSFSISGQTLTGAGAALGNCRVVVMETGRQAVSGAPIVNESISDGGGNFSIPVPMNTAYELTGYLPGSPDKAGVTRQDVVPTSTVSIYMRDPMAVDTGGTSTYSRSRVANMAG